MVSKVFAISNSSIVSLSLTTYNYHLMYYTMRY